MFCALAGMGVARGARSETRHIPLVLDATSLGNRWTILAISVVLSGCAIPVAWKVLPAEQPGSWRPYWEGLLDELGKAGPPEWDVLVLADRGLYARWLWDAIVAWGWHPFLRINVGSKARLPGEENFEWISRWVPTPGTRWQGKVECFASKKGRVNGTLLMHWEPGYASAWIILTDLEPEEALVSWYGLRTWIEGEFKDFKRGLWGWHHSKMERASSVERLWLAMALAQLWCVSLGCQAEAEFEAVCLHHEPGTSLPERHIARQRRTRAVGQRPARRLSCVVRGRLILLAMHYQSEPFVVESCGRPSPDHHHASETAYTCNRDEEENAKGKGAPKTTKTPCAGTFPRLRSKIYTCKTPRAPAKDFVLCTLTFSSRFHQLSGAKRQRLPTQH